MRYRIGCAALAVLVFAAALYVAARGPAASSPQANATSNALIAAGQRPPAPNFTGIDGWLNSSPLTVQQLHGKVVLIDFWTFSCVNCVRTLPHLRALYDTYKEQGLVIVGVHSPEFDFEKVPSNVAAAVKRDGVSWPVAIDSEMATWTAWTNNVWPAEYVIDKNGRVAYVSLGEGDYDQTARAIQTLLSVPARTIHATSIPTSEATTPEIYVGSERGSGYGLADGESYAGSGQSMTYPDATPSDSDHVLLTGTWTDHGQYVTAGAGAHVKLRWHGSSIYMVAGNSGSPLSAAVSLDEKPVPSYERGSALAANSRLTVSRNDLYWLAQSVDPGGHLVDISVPSGFQVFTFTFG